MTARSSEEGITLVEIMIALLVLGFLLTTFFTVITGSLRSLSESRAQQAASQVATEIIEGLRELSPSEIAVLANPLDTVTPQVDITAFSCGSPAVAGSFDPDGDGPLGCESIVTNTGGAVTGTSPYQGPAATDTVDGLTVTTIVTLVDDPQVPATTRRVTVVLDYELPSATRQIRRSAFFSEVSRG